MRFADHASRATLADYLHAHDVLIARRDQVEAELAQLALGARCAHTVARLRCLRGIDTLSALGLCAEIGEWERFDHPDQLAAYLGIVPCEHTTGAQRRLGVDHQGRLDPRPAAAGRGAPTTTAAARRSVKRQGAASAGNHRRSSTSPGAPNDGSTPAGANSKTPAANPTESSPSRSPANSPATAGRSPPGHPIPTRYRRHPCRRATPSRTQPRSHRSTHQPPAGDSPTHANALRHSRCGLRGGPSIPARAQQLRDSSPEQPPTRRPRSTIDSGRATNKGLGPAPEYEHDHRREPADARTAPQAATTSTTINQTMAINPYPLTSAPPYGRLCTRPAGAPYDDCSGRREKSRRRGADARLSHKPLGHG